MNREAPRGFQLSASCIRCGKRLANGNRRCSFDIGSRSSCWPCARIGICKTHTRPYWRTGDTARGKVETTTKNQKTKKTKGFAHQLQDSLAGNWTPVSSESFSWQARILTTILPKIWNPMKMIGWERLGLWCDMLCSPTDVVVSHGAEDSFENSLGGACSMTAT